MKQISLILDNDFEYPRDVDRIVKAFAAEGYWCTPEQAHHLWDKYSDSMYAGWMSLDSYLDFDIVMLCRPYFNEIGID